MVAGLGIAPRPSPLQGDAQTDYAIQRIKNGLSAGYRTPVCPLSTDGSAFELQRDGSVLTIVVVIRAA